MTQTIPESDWKTLRKLHDTWLDRFCTRVLREIQVASSTPGKTSHERYAVVYQLVRERDKELARASDGTSRSRAYMHLVALMSLDLIAPDELQQFTPETRQILAHFAE